MSLLSWIKGDSENFLSLRKRTPPFSQKNQGLWTRCERCGIILSIKHLKENQRVCFSCDYHLQMNSQERLESLLDTNTWHPLNEFLSPCDPLNFKDQKSYIERLQKAQHSTGLQDAIQTGTGLINGIPVAVGFIDFHFLAGTVGSVVGEKLTRLIEYASDKGLILIIISSSGGTRIQEGSLSLMQMAKITAALNRYQNEANLLYISILTSPTTGGATASFALLGDLVISEPNALIGFAGRKIIEKNLKIKLPEEFQTAEYYFENGFIDLIIPRFFLRQALLETFYFYKNKKVKRQGNLTYKLTKWDLEATENLKRKQLIEKEKLVSFNLNSCNVLEKSEKFELLLKHKIQKKIKNSTNFKMSKTLDFPIEWFLG